MKILGINASPKGTRSETLRLVKAALNGAESMGCEVELVDLCKLKIEYCNACGICHKKGKCYKKDDFQALYRKMIAADGLVMGSPNYFLSVTAQMKTLIDRMAYAVHCQLFVRQIHGECGNLRRCRSGTGRSPGIWTRSC